MFDVFVDGESSVPTSDEPSHKTATAHIICGLRPMSSTFTNTKSLLPQTNQLLQPGYNLGNMLISLTVGKVDAGIAILLTEDRRLVRFIPSIRPICTWQVGLAKERGGQLCEVET